MKALSLDWSNIRPLLGLVFAVTVLCFDASSSAQHGTTTQQARGGQLQPGLEMSDDEKAIRALVQRLDRQEPVPQTADSIFWSGAYKRPAVRGQSAAERVARVANRVSITTTTTVHRIEVAEARDMAYEYSDGDATAQSKEPDGTLTSNTFKSSVLRVWKKVNGEWRLAASFAHPHQQ